MLGDENRFMEGLYIPRMAGFVNEEITHKYDPRDVEGIRYLKTDLYLRRWTIQ